MEWSGMDRVWTDKGLPTLLFSPLDTVHQLEKERGRPSFFLQCVPAQMFPDHGRGTT